MIYYIPSGEEGISAIVKDFLDNLQSDSTKEKNNDVKSKEPSSITEEEMKRKKLELIQELFLLSLSKGNYDARSRTLIQLICKWIEISPLEFLTLEYNLTIQLQQEALEKEKGKEKSSFHHNTVEVAKNQRSKDKNKRMAYLGLAAVGGGLVIGLTGGLAAPLVAGGLASLFGAIGIGGTAAFLGSAGGIALITSVFGATGAGMSTYRMNNRTKGITEFFFVPHHELKVSFYLSAANNQSGKTSASSSRPASIKEEEDTRKGSWWNLWRKGSSKEEIANEEELEKAKEEIEKELELEKAKKEIEKEVTGTLVENIFEEKEKILEEKVKGENPKGIETKQSTNSLEVPIENYKREPSLEDLIRDKSKKVKKGIQPKNEVSGFLPPPFVTISINGWITKLDHYLTPWFNLDPLPTTDKQLQNIPFNGEHYSLCWESSELLSLGRAFEILLTSEAFSFALTEIFQKTILAGLMTALIWPASLLKVAAIVDNPWSVAMERARKAGIVLAEVLLSHRHGHRPITLMGASLGARVVYYCLMTLAEKAEKSKNVEETNSIYGMIENVYLFGTPVAASDEDWLKCRKLVSGRFVNCYSEKDWILGFLFRALGSGFSVAGLSPILKSQSTIKSIKVTEQSQSVEEECLEVIHGWKSIGIENYNLTELISGHLQYRQQKVLQKVFQQIGISYYLHPNK